MPNEELLKVLYSDKTAGRGENFIGPSMASSSGGPRTAKRMVKKHKILRNMLVSNQLC